MRARNVKERADCAKLFKTLPSQLDTGGGSVPHCAQDWALISFSKQKNRQFGEGGAIAITKRESPLEVIALAI